MRREINAVKKKSSFALNGFKMCSLCWRGRKSEMKKKPFIKNAILWCSLHWKGMCNISFFQHRFSKARKVFLFTEKKRNEKKD
jgi:hypothetical protein